MPDHAHPVAVATYSASTPPSRFSFAAAYRGIVMNKYPQAPDLQALVEKFGGYHKITPEAWAEHDAAMAQWHRDRRLFTCGSLIEGRKPAEKPKPKRRTYG